MTGAKPIIAVCLIFFFGCITGAAIVMVTMDNHIHHMVNDGPKALSELIVSRMSRDLELTAGQGEKILHIVDDTHSKMEAARSLIDPQITKLMNDSKAQIRAVLTAEQAAKFDKMSERMPSRWPPPHEEGGPHSLFSDGPPPPPF